MDTVENGMPVVSGGHTWTCTSEEHLTDIILPVNCTDLSQFEENSTNRCSPVVLEQAEEGSRCVVSLCCHPQHPALISSLLVVSEARTMEVYSPSGDYCGTCRGERDSDTQETCADGRAFYRKRLDLQCPSMACEVKLLSLGGRTSVAVAKVVVGLQPAEPADGVSPCLALGQSVDMERVQSMVQEMGTSLSPGAKNLMDMVQFQQTNQTAMLGGLLPLLMGGGALAALGRGAGGACGAAHTMTQPAARTRPTEPGRLPQNGALSEGESDSGTSSYGSQDGAFQSSESTAPLPPTQKASAGPASPGIHGNHSRLADMMSPLLMGLSGQARSQTPLSPDLLPVLQSVCGQVTSMRIDDAAARERERTANGTGGERSCCRAVDELMERRLTEMEARLKEHLDQRLDALELRLQTALLQALPLGSLPLGQQTKTSQTPPLQPLQPLNGH